MSKLLKKNYTDIQMDNMTQYSSMVIEDRAVPSVYDGLKPVQRKALYAASVGNYPSSGNYHKSAKLVGEIMANYHPHGDTSTYDAICNLVADYAINQPLFSGHGAFINKYGDPSAAMRYTEVKLHPFSENVLLDGLKDNAVKFVDNFDKTRKEPEVLPAKLPMILINGTTGIGAGGFAASVLPHHIDSVIEAVKLIINNPDIEVRDLIKSAKLYPHLPYGGEVDHEGIEDKYATGEGSVTIRGHVEFDTSGKEFDDIIIREIPFSTKTGNILNAIVENNTDFIGLRDISNKSEKGDIQIILHFDKGTNLELAKQQLFAKTSLKTTENLLFNLLKDGKLVEYTSIKDILIDWLDFRRATVKKTKMAKVGRLKHRVHILEGLIQVLAPEHVDETIRIIRYGEGAEDISSKLLAMYNISQAQVDYILGMKLYNINSREIEAYKAERDDKNKLAEVELDMLRDVTKIDKYIYAEIEEIKNKKYVRRNNFTTKSFYSTEEKVVDIKAVVPDRYYSLVFTKNGVVKKVEEKTKKKIINVGRLHEMDSVVGSLYGHAEDEVLITTTNGYIFKLLVHDLPLGKSLTNLGTSISPLLKGAKIASVHLLTKDSSYASILVTTRFNRSKRVAYEEITTITKAGLLLTKLADKDEVLETKLLQDETHIIYTTSTGKSVNLTKDNLPDLVKRPTLGVKVVDLSDKDEIVGGVAHTNDRKDSLLLVTAKGYIKKVPLVEFKEANRLTKGLLTMNFKEDDDRLVYSTLLKFGESPVVQVLTSAGKTHNIDVSSIKPTLRPATGTKLVDLEPTEVITHSSITN